MRIHTNLRNLLLTASIAAALPVSALGVGVALGSEPATLSEVNALLIVVASCDFNCEFGNCDEDKHELVSNSQGNDTDISGEGTHECRGPGSCGAHNCNEFNDNDEVVALVSELRGLSASNLDLLVRESGQVTLNTVREAIQVTGCDDEIILNIGLSPAQKNGLNN